MHVTAEDVIVEIIDSKGTVLPEKQAGEIVITHLATGDFPFIRYRTGDIGALDDIPCSCGRGLPLLKEIQGRTTDFIVAADGTIMHGLALIYILRDISNIENFKIIQENSKYILVLIIPADGFDKDTESVIRKGFRERLGSTVNIEVEKVSEMPPEKSGKFRYVVSNLPGR
jgi:phenylacetate-CoA ligase